MAATWNTTVTNKGIALQTKQISGATISFTRVVSGSGSVAITNLKEQTSVSSIQQILSVESLKMMDSKYAIKVILSNDDLTDEYNLSQIGFYATDPDEGEILFAISQVDEKKKIPTGASTPGYSIEFAFTFQNSNNATIQINPDMAGYVTREEVEDIANSVELGPDITEGEETLKTGWLKKTIDGISKKLFAIAHVKSTYYDYANGTTLDEMLIETEDFDQTAVTESEISPVILSKINAVSTTQEANYTELSENKADKTEVYTTLETDAAIETAVNVALSETTYVEDMLWNGYITANCNLSDDSQLVTSDGENILLTKTFS